MIKYLFIDRNGAVRSWLMSIKRQWYKIGYRPKPGTILYSPSLDYSYWYSDYVKAHDGKGPFQVGFEKSQNQARVNNVFNTREEDEL